MVVLAVTFMLRAGTNAVSIAEVTGQSLTSSVGSLSAITGTATVDLTGISMSSSIGSVVVTSWNEVNPGVSNTWTTVAPGVTNNWSEVDRAA